MAEKRYYWLKLNENFFDDDTIQFIEEQENGILYSNFYLKLCLKSLKTDGRLMRLVGETLLPYDAKSLAKLTHTDIDTVRVAIELFKKIGIIKVMDNGELFLTQVQEMTGTETDRAARLRRQRAEEKAIGRNNVQKCSANVPEVFLECSTEKEKEIEKDIDIELDKEKDLEKEKEIEKKKDIKHRYGEYKHVLLTDIEKDKLFNEYGEDKALQCITYLDEYIEMKGYKANSHYLCIRKWVLDAVNRNSNKPNPKPQPQTVEEAQQSYINQWASY